MKAYYKDCGTCGQPCDPNKVNRNCGTCRNRVKNARSKLKLLINEPHKICSRHAAAYAIACGELIPEPCEECGEEKVQAHHDVYAEGKYLDVRWLCTSCHEEWHRNNDTIQCT